MRPPAFRPVQHLLEFSLSAGLTAVAAAGVIGNGFTLPGLLESGATVLGALCWTAASVRWIHDNRELRTFYFRQAAHVAEGALLLETSLSPLEAKHYTWGVNSAAANIRAEALGIGFAGLLP